MSENASNQYRHTVDNTPAELAAARAVIAANARNPDDYATLTAALGLTKATT